MGFLQAGSEGDRAEGCGLDGACRRGRLKQVASSWLPTEHVVFSPHWGRGAKTVARLHLAPDSTFHEPC